jgi:rhodanese-related sulfurtransferase
MVKTIAVITLQAAGIVVIAAIVAIGTNAIRSDGIPLIAEIEYEIFAPCKDSEVESQAANVEDLASAGGDAVLYVDARPAEAFTAEHVKGSINIPYSVLFGASKEDIARVKEEMATREAKTVIVFGKYAEPKSTEAAVDLAEPLAQQLIEAEVAGVKHLEGGIDELKKTGVETVKKSGGTN